MSAPNCRRAAFAALGAVVALVTAACTQDTVATPPPASNASPPTSNAPAVGESGVPNAKGGGIAAGTTFTPIVGSTFTTPAPVRGTDGRTHLAYELVLTVALNLPFQLQRVEVRDAATRAVLQTVSDAQLGADVTSIFDTSREADATPPATPAPMAPASTSVVWLDVTVPEGAACRGGSSTASSARSPCRREQSAPLDQVITTVDVATEPPSVLGWPVPAGDWYMSDGCCADDTHHRAGCRERAADGSAALRDRLLPAGR